MTTAISETPAATPQRTALVPKPRVLRAELLKIWTTNSWWIFGIIMLAFTALALIGNIVQANQQLHDAVRTAALPAPNFGVGQGMSAADVARMQQQYLDSINIPKILVNSAAQIYTSGQYIGLLMMVVLGALIVTNEFFHQTATTTFLTVPARTKVIVAKLGAAMVLACAFWLVITVIDLAAGSIFFSASGHGIPLADWPVLRSLLFNLLAFVIWAVMGIGLGVLIRSQLGATLTGAAFYMFSTALGFAVFFLITQYIIKEPWLWNLIVLVPGVASTIMISPDPLELPNNLLGPPWWAGAVALVGYGILAGVIGTLITRKRDIS